MVYIVSPVGLDIPVNNSGERLRTFDSVLLKKRRLIGRLFC